MIEKRKGSTALLVYGLLASGALIFSFPFLWLAATSVKVDRELMRTDRSMLPMQPIPRVASPYIDTEYYTEPKAPKKFIIEALPVMIDATGFKYPEEVSKTDLEGQLIRGLYKKLVERIPNDVWTKGEAVMLAAVRKEVTPEAVGEAFKNVYRDLRIQQLTVRSNELVEERLNEKLPVSQRLDIQTATVASLIDREEKKQSYALLKYDYSKGEKIVLTRTFDLSFEAEKLQRVQLFLRPDDSWHELWLTLERNGKKFEAMRPEVLANYSGITLTWQEPSADDNSTKFKTWTLLKETGSSEITGKNQVRLSFEFRRSTTTGALAHKGMLNYRKVLDQIPFWRYVSVSLFLVLANITLALISSSLVAYAFSRLQWPGRDFCFMLMLATMMIPAQVTAIPHFFIWKAVGAYDTLTPLWLGSAFGNAFFIFLLRQTLKGIPRDLEDAARIDGCGFLRIYWHIMLPLVKPSLAAIAIFSFMGSWNDFMGPLLYISDQRLYPLAFGLYAFSVQITTSPVMTMAGNLLMTVPVIVIFFFAQKYFIQGITMSGMKG